MYRIRRLGPQGSGPILLLFEDFDLQLEGFGPTIGFQGFGFVCQQSQGFVSSEKTGLPFLGN